MSAAAARGGQATVWGGPSSDGPFSSYREQEPSWVGEEKRSEANELSALPPPDSREPSSDLVTVAELHTVRQQGVRSRTEKLSREVGDPEDEIGVEEWAAIRALQLQDNTMRLLLAPPKHLEESLDLMNATYALTELARNLESRHRAPRPETFEPWGQKKVTLRSVHEFVEYTTCIVAPVLTVLIDAEPITRTAKGRLSWCCTLRSERE